MQVTQSHLQQNLDAVLNKVKEDNFVYEIERDGHVTIILMAKTHFDSMLNAALISSKACGMPD